LIISMGPRVFVWKVRSASLALICAGDFSGKRSPGTKKESCRRCVPGGNCALHAAAASAMVDSSVGCCQPVGGMVDWETCGLPVTSSFNTFSRDSSISSPSSNSSFVLSRSMRAVATTGALVVCSTLLASAKPMPREAGEIMDHGGIVRMDICLEIITLE